MSATPQAAETPVRPGAAEATVTGVVDSVRFVGRDGQFAVLALRVPKESEPVVVVGEVAGFSPGEEVRFVGRREEHPVYGARFRARSWVPLMPKSADGVAKFLGSGLVRGVGKRTADRIVAHFGAGALDIIATQGGRLAQVRGVGKKRADALTEIVRARRAEADGIAFLHALGLGPALAKKIHAKYGARTAEQLRSDPYRAAEELPGIGFLTADRVGREAGIAEDDPRRAEGAVLYLVGRAADEGHVLLPQAALARACVELAVPADRVAPAVEALRARGMIIADAAAPEGSVGPSLYAPPLHAAEVGVAVRLRALGKGAPLEVKDAAAIERAIDPALNAEQREAVRQSLTSRVLVLTGGPGTGKTTTVRALLAAAVAAGRVVALAAPTGRAAKRLTETTGKEAKTLHRLLEWTPTSGGFQRGEDEPLEADLVLVDEASMLDVRLGHALLCALAPSAQLVLVGDADQLPPVGAGQVLRELIASEIAPSVRLVHVFRQAEASAIIRGAHAILAGRAPTPSPPQTRGAGELFVVRVPDAEAGPAKVVEVVRRIATSYGLDPLRDVQVLAPMKKGAFGVDRLNEVMQEALGPGASSAPASGRAQRFRAGDKVMQTANDYEREVWNGDVGWVERVESGVTYVTFDGKRTSYRADELDPLVLAYAATVHKAQGSEFPAVVVALHGSHHVMLDRALLYTAVTRARRLVVLVGDEAAIARAARNARASRSWTLLRERLRGDV